MKKTMVTGLLGLYSLIRLKCRQSDATPVLVEAVSQKPIASNSTKSSMENSLAEDNAVVHTIVRYHIVNDRLLPDCLFNPPQNPKLDVALWEQEKTDQNKHQRLFNRFAQIIPQKYREGIKYFSIIDPNLEDVYDVYCAIGPQNKEFIEPFCLYMAFDLGDYSSVADVPNKTNPNILGYDFLLYTMIHEFGHYVTMNKSQQDLVEGCFIPKQKSICGQILLRPAYKEMDNCSSEAELSRCKKKIFKRGEFVTEYATDSLEEDAAETFAHFVLTDKPSESGVSGADEKILLFYQDPKMVQIRAAIRANFKKLGIYPNMSPDNLKKLFITGLKTVKCINRIRPKTFCKTSL